MPLLKPYAAQHASVNGPGDARPTALQIIRDQGLIDNLSGKVFLITGCSSGIGIETARAIYATGADVFMTARDMQKVGKVRDDILKEFGRKGGLEVIEMSLDSLASVKIGAADFLRMSSTLNVLICNAGRSYLVWR